MNRTPKFLVSFVTSVLLLWSVASGAWIYPHSLSYFNESIVGPLNGPKNLLGSCVDWGQDLRYLKWWLEEHPEENPICLAYYGYFGPSEVGIECDVPVVEASAKRFSVVDPGWYVFSVNILGGFWWPARDGKGFSKVAGNKCASYFRSMREESRVGLSIVIYHEK